MSFLEENEVIVVAREKSDQFGTAGEEGKPPAFH